MAIQQHLTFKAPRLTFSLCSPQIQAKATIHRTKHIISLGKEQQKHIQTIDGKFLWYAQAVDGTLLTLLSALAAQQSKPMEKTMK